MTDTTTAPEDPVELAPLPERGRRFATTRRVRLADADPSGRLRLDALARFLQDVGNDDFRDAGLDPASPWVARRTLVVAARWPQLGERMEVTTWCGGLGSRWAERRSRLTTASGGVVDVASLWVHLDDAGRPARLPAWFLDTYGETAAGRTVSARLRHPAPPEGAPARPWPLRVTDLDVLRHVNNAATWAAVEDGAYRAGLVPTRAELEYHAAIEPSDEIDLVADGGEVAGAELRLWLRAGAVVRASALVRGEPAR